MGDEQIAELYANEETGEVIFELDQPAVALTPEQAEEWCISFHEAAKQAREAQDD